MVKIIEKIRKHEEEKKPFYSFEFFPPKTKDGVYHLYNRLDRMAMLEPMFVDVTWGAGGSTSDLTHEISCNALHYLGTEVMMHLTCTNMPKKEVKAALDRAKEAGIQNILALRGDPPLGVHEWEQCDDGFAHAVDLVKFIRKEYGDYFGVCVAGYPEGHVAAESKEQDLKYLKEKVDAGADFIITQLFYSVETFLDWVKKCRDIGIKCPILPGIMPIQNYKGFKRMTTFCKTLVPQSIEDALESIKDDEKKVKQFGIKLAIDMCNELLKTDIGGLHFYTLNLERSCTKILEGLGFVRNIKQIEARPWRQSKKITRKEESVRPIFWANRPKSYVHRTKFWDDFPNGRWGDSRSPAYGDLHDYHLTGPLVSGNVEERRKLWGSNPKTQQDIYQVFVDYVCGKISRLPWCETELQSETHDMLEELARINYSGFLTINSQPAVNGAESENKKTGWGPKGGYVYQKAYLEFFTSAEHLKKLIKLIEEKYPNLTYHATNAKGEELHNTINQVTAVTWGSFPGREIIQPTIVDVESFRVWKDEAFSLWKSQWENLYDEEKESAKLIQHCHDQYYLVNIVDNDYVKSNILNIFDEFISSEKIEFPKFEFVAKEKAVKKSKAKKA